jgi:hypothetical protein
MVDVRPPSTSPAVGFDRLTVKNLFLSGAGTAMVGILMIFDDSNGEKVNVPETGVKFVSATAVPGFVE